MLTPQLACCLRAHSFSLRPGIVYAVYADADAGLHTDDRVSNYSEKEFCNDEVVLPEPVEMR